ncbi:hypothetical protein AVEN_103037-1 [Araneus ventricosus]|uniref:Uncharacterized protein n=1 Tax=Araneus ventricosus TaxID=182803 RepID=A0A4Y2BB93_ARAVE|nr:hypothetical protein AVEN_103037-1 [Araneus ventricosus]
MFDKLKPCSHGVWLGKPQTSRSSRFVLVDYGRWNSDQSLRRKGAWLCKSLSSARVIGCIDAVWPLPSFDVRAIYHP